jgi:hypothetical protein
VAWLAQCRTPSRVPPARRVGEGAHVDHARPLRGSAVLGQRMRSPSQARGRGLPPAWRASLFRPLGASCPFCCLPTGLLAGWPTDDPAAASPQADLAFLSAFPGEKEVLYPPLTHLRPTGRSQKVDVHATHRDVEYEVYEVKVSIG